MSYSIAASHAKGKFATDKIFGANAAAVAAAAEHGQEKVVNATIGAILDDKEKLVCLPTVEQVFRNLPVTEIANYAPISGLPEYLDAVIGLIFADQKPDAYTAAIATAGGTGALHHTIWNYTEIGDTVLTSDYFWGPYRVLCDEAMRKLDTYTLFDENLQFNLQNFTEKVKGLLEKQDSLVVIINTPAHNPTGYSLSDTDWDQVLDVFRSCAKTGKRIIVLVDAAYIDYAGERNECRKFLTKFSGLPENMLAIVAFSMSKSFTLYGQRTGAMIGISSNQDVITEFKNINQFTSRATWSNINRGAMRVLATVYHDKTLFEQVEQERRSYYQLTQERASIFMQEAAKVNLKVLPYIAGFFITIPANNTDAICERLHRDNIFAVPLAKGVRIAICAIPTHKVNGMATKFAQAISELK